MTKKQVLVTGGAGFIGSHVAELALARGYDVLVLDNLSQGKREWVPEGASFIEGDVTNLSLVRDAVAGRDGVFHLAAMSRVLPSIGGGPEIGAVLGRPKYHRHLERAGRGGRIEHAIPPVQSSLQRVIHILRHATGPAFRGWPEWLEHALRSIEVRRRTLL